MNTFLLVIILSIPGIEQHIAIVMPDEETCHLIRGSFIYATLITKGETVEDDERMLIHVDEVRCEEGDDE